MLIIHNTGFHYSVFIHEHSAHVNHIHPRASLIILPLPSGASSTIMGCMGGVDELHQGCLCHRSIDTLPAATALKKMLPHQLLSLCKSGDGGSTAEPLLVTGCWQTQCCPDPVLEITAAVSSGSWELHTSPLSSPALTFFPPLHLRCFLSLLVWCSSYEPTISHHFSPKLWPIRNLHTLLTTAGRGFWDPSCWHSCTALWCRTNAQNSEGT